MFPLVEYILLHALRKHSMSGLICLHIFLIFAIGALFKHSFRKVVIDELYWTLYGLIFNSSYISHNSGEVRLNFNFSTLFNLILYLVNNVNSSIVIEPGVLKSNDTNLFKIFITSDFV